MIFCSELTAGTSSEQERDAISRGWSAKLRRWNVTGET